MKIKLTIRCVIRLLMVLSLGSGLAHAIVDPEAQKNNTPNVLKCTAERVSSNTSGETTNYSAFCRVLDVIKSSSAIKPGDLIYIRYSVNYAEIRRQVREMEETKMPGLAPASAPRPLQDGQVVIAYLRASRSPNGSLIYIPNIGFESFEFVAPQSAQQVTTRCSESGESGIMANEKVCAEKKLHESEQALTSLIAELESRIERQVADDPALEAAMQGQADSLAASHTAWQQYRDETCRYAYFQYFPGSMVRLEELACRQNLTERRLGQLKRISSLAGEPIDY